MRQCVASGPVVPMNEEWFKSILQMIPLRLRQGPTVKDVIDDTFEEVQGDYHASMEKSMGE